MGFRFRRTVRIAPGVRLNFSKRGTSMSLGGHGVTENISKRGTRMTYSLRGTGLSYTTKTSKASGCGCAIPMMVFGIAIIAATVSVARRVGVQRSPVQRGSGTP
jgi:hypothetical protein